MGKRALKLKPQLCERCGEKCPPGRFNRSGLSAFCSVNCTNRAWEKRSGSSTLIRAIRRGAVRSGEAIPPEAVFIRDGWVCQICRELVDPELQYPDPRAASLDHLIPISRGGAHAWDNVQCAHLVCNLRKGNRT